MSTKPELPNKTLDYISSDQTAALHRSWRCERRTAKPAGLRRAVSGAARGSLGGFLLFVTLATLGTNSPVVLTSPARPRSPRRGAPRTAFGRRRPGLARRRGEAEARGSALSLAPGPHRRPGRRRGAAWRADVCPFAGHEAAVQATRVHMHIGDTCREHVTM